MTQVTNPIKWHHRPPEHAGFVRMPHRLFARYTDLQSYVNWDQSDAERIARIARIVDRSMESLVDDFYSELQKHPDASRVITGGSAQIARLMESLRNWLRESLQGHSDAGYVTRRWKIGLRHAEIGLNPAFVAAAMSRLRNGIIGVVCAEAKLPPLDLCAVVQSINKMIDLDLSIIHDAYETEYLRREKAAEHERSEAKFRMLVETAVGLVMILKEDETVVYSSPDCEELTGYRVDDVLGNRFTSLLIAESAREEVSTALAKTIKGQPIKAFDGPITHCDGRERWFVWNAQRLDDFEGTPAVIVVGQDVTEQREDQQKLLRSERLAGIGQMITGIAHESRNALQRIQSCTEMLELEVENNPEAQRLVQRLQEAQDNLLRLFDEVRNFAAPIQLHMEPCRLSSLWHEAWNQLEKSRAGRDAGLSEKYPNDHPLLALDRFRIVQVFRNLFENSLAASSDPVRVEIRCEHVQLQDRPFTQICVRDNGPGLTPLAKQSVFEPFFTTKTKGTGLGMAIARRIVEAHGGSIVVGAGQHVGAEFIITLPENHL